jgi:uncharacterized protein YggT (Ycf19 family)
MQDRKLAQDEADRSARYQEVKDEVRDRMKSEVSQNAGLTESERAEVAGVGTHLKDKAVGELVETDREVERARGAARVSQIVDYVFYLIYSLIGLEILLELLGARENNAFKNFIDTISAPFLLPFNTLMPDLGAGRFQLRLSYIMALIVYLILHVAINGLLRLFVHRKTTV